MDKRKHTTIDLPVGLHLALRQMLLGQGRTLGQWVTAHAEEDLKREGKKK